MKRNAVMEERISKAEPFEIDPEIGLSDAQVKKRIEEGLENKVQKHPTKTYWQIIKDNLFNFINILLFAVFVLMLIAKLPLTHYFFMFILAANIAIGLFQDIHARKLCDSLKVVSDPKGTVVREGQEKEISANEIVLSDVLVIALGDQVLCDSVVLDGECQVDESLLTGESLPVTKKKGDLLLSGTFLTKGKVHASAVKVGAANYAECLQGNASVFIQPKSEIKRSVGIFVGFTGFVAIFIGLAMYISFGVTTGEWIGFFTNQDMVKAVSGSMVAMLPTGMFLLTSTSLAVGVIALAKKKMLVQQLYCIEMLARVDAICFDKTGTLTDGTMAVIETIPLDGISEEEIRSACAKVLAATKDDNATAKALRASFGEESVSTSSVIPFDSTLKYSAVSDETGTTYGFGAFGFLPLSESEALKEKVQAVASKGHRVVVAGRASQPIQDERAPKDMRPLGLVVLSDHIKEDAADNVAWFQNNGVKVRIISGDDPVTVAEIARRVGVNNAERYVSLEGKTVEECAALVDDYAVFGRVNPEQKAALITAIQEQGHKVAMTGDGVNDILALKTADCSIAMASGSDAARSVAHLVSLENDFSKLPEVVHQGRRVINNLQRTCSLFLNKTFFAFILSFLFLILQSVLGDDYRYPFVTQNLFVWECFSVGFAAFFLALQPSKDRLKGSFLRNIVFRSVPAGIAEAVSALIPLFVVVLEPSWFTYLTDPQEIYQLAITMAVFSFTLLSLVILLRVCLPLTSYRAAVVVGALVCSVVAFVLDYFNILDIFQLNFGVRYSGMTWGFPLVVFISVLVSAVLYLALDALSYLIEKKTEKHLPGEEQK